MMKSNNSAKFLSKFKINSVVSKKKEINPNLNKKLDNSTSDQYRQKSDHKTLSYCNCRSSIKIFILIFLLITIIAISIIILLAFKPCLMTKCHKNASLCINRFPFWAQCICDLGYAGNGKSHCTECGISYVKPNLHRVVGGKDSLVSSWPFAVYIVQSYRGKYEIKGTDRIINYSWICGGTILNQRTILTAAHCIQDNFFQYEDEQGDFYTLEIKWNQWYSNVESTLRVYAGIHDTRKINNSIKLQVKRVNKHEDYDEYTLLNDVATLELNENIEIRRDIQFACLPDETWTAYPEENTTAYIIGWGQRSENGLQSAILQNTRIEIYEYDKCSRVQVDVKKNWDSQVCAGTLDGSRDTCQGDSGGGLFVDEILNTNQSKYFVSGIVSYGDGCARIQKPGIYSRVSYFIEWIRKHSDF